MISFVNRGEIDPRLITTFGVNVKETDNPIGYFGTGLKYAIAVLLRHRQKVTIWSGETELRFASVDQTIRGKTFSIVTMNGEPLGFSLDLGKNWELWMAYRELYSNCRDENGEVIDGQASPAAGTTVICVQGWAFEQIRRSHDKFFLTTTPRFATADGEIHDGVAPGYYYRGVLVSRFEHHSLYSYNILRQLTLTEDRTIRDNFTANHTAAKVILACTDKSILEDILTADDKTFERNLDLDWSDSTSEEFFQVLEELAKNEIWTINQSALSLFRKRRARNAVPEPAEMDELDQKRLEISLAFCKDMGIPITFPVVYCNRLGDHVWGLALDGTIYISREAFSYGTKVVVSTLVEEQIHLQHKLADCTRGMQEFLFNKMVSLAERLRGEPL